MEIVIIIFLIIPVGFYFWFDTDKKPAIIETESEPEFPFKEGQVVDNETVYFFTNEHLISDKIHAELSKHINIDKGQHVYPRYNDHHFIQLWYGMKIVDDVKMFPTLMASENGFIYIGLKPAKA